MATLETGTGHGDTHATREPEVRPVRLEASLFSAAITPALTRRLAEAALSLTGTGELYVLARYEPSGSDEDPYDITLFAGPLGLVEALAEMNRLGPSLYGVFGPFTIPPMASVVPQATVDEVGAIVTMPDGSRLELLGTSGSGHDTLFWTISSVRKFAVPYYTQLYSPEFAIRVLEKFESATVPLMVHMPWSEYGFVGENFASTDGLGETVAGLGTRGSQGMKEAPAFFEPQGDGTYQLTPFLPTSSPRA